jgi:hypothetical protein
MNNPEEIVEKEDEFTLKEKLKYLFIGVLSIGGSFLVGRKIVRKARSNKEEKKSATEGSPADYAQRLNMAFENDNWFGWGTDEAAIRSTLLEIPTREIFARTMSSYQKLYNRSLMKDLKDELTISEYTEMMAIINVKPERGKAIPASSSQHYTAWAKRLKAAFQETNWGIFPGTDEAAVKAVFLEWPTQDAYRETAMAYKKLYDADLGYDLKDELTIGEFLSMIKILKAKPEK